MLVYHGKIAVLCFIASVSGGLMFAAAEVANGQNCFDSHLWWLLVSYYILLNIAVLLFFSDYTYQIAARACFLGWAFSLGLCILWLADRTWAVFGLYVCFLSFFHWSEFIAIAVTNPRTLSVDSFILNHSAAYGFAALASWLEFGCEWFLFPTLKQEWLLPVTCVGTALCVGGELLRKAAMLTARTSFTHVVQNVREEDHRLVTTGVYGWCRHPSYVGWFYWSVGTQLVLVNPLCTVGYAIVSWRFFNERVLVEEATLLSFYGEEYYEYQQKVPTGLPGIQGYKIDK